MKKIIATLLFLSMISGINAQDKTSSKDDENKGIEFFEGSWEELLAHAKETGRPFFVDFYTTWCGPCKMMKKNTFANANVGSYTMEHFIAYAVDAEKGEGATLADKYKVQAYPSIFFYNEHGRVLGKSVGYKGPDAFLVLLKKYKDNNK